MMKVATILTIKQDWNRRTTMRIWKKMTALVLAAAVMVGTPLAACAKNAWIDGNTPEELTNRVTTTSGEVIWPSVVTDFHATDLAALVPITPMNVFDVETGANISQYADAATHVYVGNNREYGQIAKSALDSARWAVGAQMGPSFTMNLFLYEGGVYKPRESTIQEMDFVMEIPKSLRDNTRDFAVLRLNADGTVSYLTDLDADPKTITFRTNYFGTYSVYCLVYGGHGCFDAYKPAPQLIPVDQATLAAWAAMGIPTDPVTLAALGFQAVP
jgi:hypothetical protein